MGEFCLEVNPNTTWAGAEPGSFLYDREGNRKYLTILERNAFLDAASTMPPEVRTFCRTLAYTGARISEVLALTPRRIDATAGLIVIESLKKRRRGVSRPVPVPKELIAELDSVHAILTLRNNSTYADQRIWDWCRTTAWHRVKKCMLLANVCGKQAMPKGLRHAFAVGTLQSAVPVTIVKNWLGHARLETTEIYLNAVGEEERLIAARFWGTF